MNYGIEARQQLAKAARINRLKSFGVRIRELDVEAGTMESTAESEVLTRSMASTKPEVACHTCH